MERGKSDASDKNLVVCISNYLKSARLLSLCNAEITSKVLSFAPFKIRILSLRACDLELFISSRAQDFTAVVLVKTTDTCLCHQHS